MTDEPNYRSHRRCWNLLEWEGKTFLRLRLVFSIRRISNLNLSITHISSFIITFLSPAGSHGVITQIHLKNSIWSNDDAILQMDTYLFGGCETRMREFNWSEIILERATTCALDGCWLTRQSHLLRVPIRRHDANWCESTIQISFTNEEKVIEDNWMS